MSINLLKIIQSMGVMQLVIAGTLVLMAIASSAVFLERLWVLMRAGRASGLFAGTATAHIEAQAFDKLAESADQAKGSPLAALLGAGARTFIKARRKPGPLGPVELARREMERKVETVGGELRRGMSVLASVGSVAPFVGLLGTVMGIIAAFEGIAKEGSGGLGAVSAGIAEALVVTALGLFVAIPSVLAFNFLSTRIDGLMVALDQARGELVDSLEVAGGAPTASGAEPHLAAVATVKREHADVPAA